MSKLLLLVLRRYIALPTLSSLPKSALTLQLNVYP